MVDQRRTTGSESVAVFRETLDRLLQDERVKTTDAMADSVLQALRKAGRPMALAELAEATGLSVDDVRAVISEGRIDDMPIQVSVPARAARARRTGAAAAPRAPRAAAG